MTDITAALNAVSNELTEILKDTKSNSVAMTFDEFLAYCNAQIELAKADSNPATRVNALLEAVKLAKVYTWEDGDTMSVSVFTQGESADAEKLNSSFAIPGPQATPAAGAFEAASGPTGPASNTASPAGRYMPPTFPQSMPEGMAEGFMAKAKELIGKAANGEQLARELAGLFAEQPRIEQSQVDPKGDDGWPLDLATESFLNDKPEVVQEDDFGRDPVRC